MGTTKVHQNPLCTSRATSLVAAMGLVVAAVLVFATGAALAQGTGSPAENWAKVAACAQLEPGDERQACVDDVFRSAGLLDRARELAQQRESFGEQRRERPQPAPPVAAATPRPSPVPAPTPSPAELDRIVTTVSRAFDPGNRLMVIVTQEGQVWQQNESKDLGLPPRAGTSFTVEKGSLGSFNCRIGGGRSFRCRRQG
jgi:hypothetical protein